MTDMKVTIVYTVFLVEILMKLYLLEHCWKNLPEYIFPEEIYYIPIF